MDQTLHRVATKEREEIKRTTKQKMAKRHNREGWNHLDQASNRQTTMEDIDGGLHPEWMDKALDEDEGSSGNSNNSVRSSGSSSSLIVVVIAM